MEFSEAIEKKKMLHKELQEINRLVPSSKTGLSILPILVDKEFNRLSDDIGDAVYELPMQPDDIRIPVEGESMLSKMPFEFGLSSAEATEKFKQNLKSELEELMKSNVQYPFTSEFIQKVIDHSEAYLKKQRQHERAVFGPKDDQIDEMDCSVAEAKRDRLRAELNLIRSRARAKAVNLSYLLKLMDAEFDRLSHGIMSMKSMPNEIKIPVEGVSMLSRVPAEYGLLFASDTEKFMQKLSSELRWVMSSGGQFPLTFQFIQRVIGYAERYMKEMRSFEVAVFGRSTNNRTA